MTNNYQSFTVNGIANVYIENPLNEDKWEVFARINRGPISNKLKLAFQRNIKDIGPVFGVLGQLAPDGTEVRIGIEGNNHYAFSNLKDGKLTYQIPFQWEITTNTSIEVSIGGQEQKIMIGE